jgi:pimeloyl-ACP methyl ester carboxylesterase
MALRARYGLGVETAIVAGRPVRTLTSGVASTAPEVVFLPGLGLLGYVAPWVRAVSAWTKINLLDLPGWHAGGTRSCPPTTADIAATTAGWLTGHRRRVLLVGHSSAAQAVLRAARLAPEHVSAVVLANPVFDPDGRTWRALTRNVRVGLRHERWGELPQAIPSVLASGVVSMIRLLRSALHERPEELGGPLPMPGFVVTSTLDPVAPVPWARQLAELTGADFQLVDGPHNWCWTDTGEADRALRRIAAAVPKTPGEAVYEIHAGKGIEPRVSSSG